MIGGFLSAVAAIGLSFAAAANPLFESDELLEVTLEGPLAAVLRDDRGEPEQFPFTLTVAGQNIPVQVRQRGNFRRLNCRFPPLRLNFKKKETKGSVFEGQNKLKLVTHCQSATAYEQNTLEEYNAYRIFNLVTPVSFRVRLLRVNYVNEKGKTVTRHAFVIEDVDDLAKRAGGEHIQPAKIKRQDLDMLFATRVAIFQYLIGNTDFSSIAALEGLPCCHNGKLIRVESRPGLYSVPYDFDMSGLVNAKYATPNPVFNIRSVRQRKYWGFCTDDSTLEEAVASYRDLRDDIDGLFRSTPGMGDKDVKRSMSYLDAFYKDLAKRDSKNFEKSCRGGPA